MVSGETLATRHYQLTHDYLVPSLARLAYAKTKGEATRAGGIASEPTEPRHGRPSPRIASSRGFGSGLSILFLTRRRDWTPAQKKMMRGARNYYGARAPCLATVLGLIVWGAGEYLGRSEARALRDRLLSAKIAEVPAIVNDMGPYRHWVNPLLHEAQIQAEANQDSTKILYFASGSSVGRC